MRCRDDDGNSSKTDPVFLSHSCALSFSLSPQAMFISLFIIYHCLILSAQKYSTTSWKPALVHNSLRVVEQVLCGLKWSLIKLDLCYRSCGRLVRRGWRTGCRRGGSSVKTHSSNSHLSDLAKMSELMRVKLQPCWIVYGIGACRGSLEAQTDSQIMFFSYSFCLFLPKVCLLQPSPYTKNGKVPNLINGMLAKYPSAPTNTIYNKIWKLDWIAGWLGSI